MVATGISSTVSAGIIIGGLANVAGNVNVGQNVSIGGTLTVNGKSILPAQNVVIPPPVYVVPNKSTLVIPTATKGDATYATPNATNQYPELVCRNGLIEVPLVHYTVSNGRLIFNSPAFGGETVYAYWNTP